MRYQLSKCRTLGQANYMPGQKKKKELPKWDKLLGALAIFCQ